METSTLPANIVDMKTAIISAAASTIVGSGELFMKFSKGTWSFGAEETEPEEGATWLINASTMARGFQAWGATGTPADGTLLGELINTIGKEPLVGELPDVGVKWQAAASLQMTCLDGEDKDVQVIFKTCSLGGVRAFNEKILFAVAQRLQKSETHVFPIVELAVTGYDHPKKSIGWVHTPDFKIVGWADMDGEQAAETATPIEDKTDEEPAVEPVQEEEPTRRRRRKAS